MTKATHRKISLFELTALQGVRVHNGQGLRAPHLKLQAGNQLLSSQGLHTGTSLPHAAWPWWLWNPGGRMHNPTLSIFYASKASTTCMLLSSFAASWGWTLACFDDISSDFYMLEQPLKLSLFTNWSLAGGRGGLSPKVSFPLLQCRSDSSWISNNYRPSLVQHKSWL